jgi:hypothetical protein
LYLVLDNCQHSDLFTEENGDDEIVRLLSCYLRLDKDGDAIWQAAETAYEKFFRDGLLKAASGTVLPTISSWRSGIDEVTKQLTHLNCYLMGTSGSNIPSLHFPSKFSLSDDYRATVRSLRLQPHLLAILLKFRALYPQTQWHDRLPIQASAFPLYSIHVMLNDVRKRAGGDAAARPLLDYIDKLLGYNNRPKPAISMLETVERIQMLDWNMGARRYQRFAGRCQFTFNLSAPTGFIAQWIAWRLPDDFIHNILYSYNDPNLKFLLTEYVRGFGTNLHSG